MATGAGMRAALPAATVQARQSASSKGGSIVVRQLDKRHLVVGLMREGYRVGAIDLDARQGTLSGYLSATTPA